MDKLIKLNTLINGEKERSWIFSLKTKEVLNHIAYMRAMWDDAASRSLWSRYVNPYCEETERIITSKALTIQKSEELSSLSKNLFENSINVEHLSEEINDFLRKAKEEQTNSANSLADGQKCYKKYIQESPIVDKKIAEWNRDCNKFSTLYNNRKSIYAI